MASSYPGGIDSFSTKTSAIKYLAAHMNDVQNAIVAIETALGVNLANLRWAEDLSSQCDGSETDFTVANAYRTQSLDVLLNGVAVPRDEIAELTDTTFRLNDAPHSDDELIVHYYR